MSARYFVEPYLEGVLLQYATPEPPLPWADVDGSVIVEPGSKNEAAYAAAGLTIERLRGLIGNGPIDVAALVRDGGEG